jgi:hypothetical protein
VRRVKNSERGVEAALVGVGEEEKSKTLMMKKSRREAQNEGSRGHVLGLIDCAPRLSSFRESGKQAKQRNTSQLDTLSDSLPHPEYQISSA